MKKNQSRQSLAINEDFQFQQLFWKIEKVGWFFLLLILGAAVLGFTGTGPLNNTTIKDENIQVDYKQFARQLSPTQLIVQISNDNEGDVRFWIDQAFLNHYQIQRITPEPNEVVANNNRFEYAFTSNQNPLKVKIELQPSGPGFTTGEIGQEDSSLVSINQIIYP